MRRSAEPIGSENDAHLLAAVVDASVVVAAWGVNGSHRNRDDEVFALLKHGGIRVKCLQRTTAGHPRHPLYANGDLKPTHLLR
jgi:hypothetical protein